MNITNPANDGINGSSVTNFNLTRSTITGAGDAANEFGVFITNLLGTNTIDNSSITNSETQNLRVLNNVATLGTLTISNSVFTGTSVANGSDAINVTSDASGNLTVNLTGNNDLNNTQGDGIQGSASGSGTLRITVDGTDSNFNGNLGSAVNIAAANSSHIIALIQDFNGVSTGTTTLNGLNVFNIQNLDTSTIEATVRNNIITGIGNNAAGIRFIQEGTGTVTGLAHNNTITGLTGGIFGQARASATPGLGTLNLTIHDNTVTLTNPAANDGIDVQAGSSAGTDRNTVNLDLFNNNSSSTPAGQSGYRLAVTNLAVFHLEDFSGSGTSSTDVTNWVTGKANTGTVQVLFQGAGAFSSIADVTEPSLPLLAADGGVDAASASDGSGPTTKWDYLGIPGPSAADTPPSGTDAPPQTTPAQATTPSDGAASAANPADAFCGPSPVSPQADAPTAPASPIVDDGVLSQAELDFIVNAAIARWADAGLSAEQIAVLEHMTFSVGDMSGLNLGAFATGHITLDSDAAGNGWFLDATPGDDFEFGQPFGATRLWTSPTDAPAGHYDVLTTVMHEMGHALGLQDSYAAGDRDDLMYGYLYVGERRLPGGGEADGAVAGAITSEEFLASPINIGTLRPGETVTVQWLAEVDPQSNQLIANPTNQGTVTSTNFPGTTTNVSVTTLDSLTLGDRVFIDANLSGSFDAGEGIDGVALSLFADFDGAGDFSAGDTLLATATTAGGGLYSFVGIAPGNYIVRVDQVNFDAGGVLNDPVAGAALSVAGQPDPDNDLDGDDNGAPFAGNGAVSLPITLDYGTEPTADATGQNDINDTLDFGFTFVPLNAAPTVTAGSTVGFSEATGTPVQLEALLTVADADGDQIQSATVTITNFFAGDVLTFTIPAPLVGIVTGSYNPGNGTLTFSGAADAADYQDILRSVFFDSGSDNPDGQPTPGAHTPRSIAWTVNDGTQNNTVAASTIVNITTENDAPSVTPATLAAVLEDNGNPAGASVAALFAGLFADPDNPAATISGILVSANPENAAEGSWEYSTGGGVWFAIGAVDDTQALALSAATLVRFVPAADFFGTPAGLTAFGLDATYAGGFTVGGVPVLVPTTPNGGIAGISDDPTTLDTSVTPINDPPSFDEGIDPVVDEDAGAQTFSAWATNIRPARNESGQTLNRSSVTNNTATRGVQRRPGGRSVPGNLTFTAAPNSNGTATITVELIDNGPVRHRPTTLHLRASRSSTSRSTR